MTLKSILGFAKAEKDRIDRCYEASSAELKAWKDDQQAVLDAAAEQLRDRAEAIDVGQMTPLDGILEKMKTDAEGEEELMSDIEKALAAD